MLSGKPRSDPRIAPLGILALAFGVGMAVILTVVILAIRQPALGVTFSITADGEGVMVKEAGKEPLPVAGIVSRKTSSDLLPIDLTVEPDGSMGDYATYGRFIARQEKLAEIQRSGRFNVLTHTETTVGVTPSGKGRPLSSLPPAFWVQLSVGLVCFLVSAGVFAFRSESASARYLLLSGASTLMFAPAAALYSTRELALPGALFHWANDLNFLGGSLFAASLVAMLLHYPRKLAPAWVGLSVVGLFLAWFAAQEAGFFVSMTFARRFLVMVAMFTSFALAAVHWFGTRRDPVARAALKWFLLSWILGTGLFGVGILLPQLFGVDTSRFQGYAFLLFILVYAGLAFGILRYRLFELGEWWRRILAGGALAAMLVTLYLCFVIGLHLSPGLSLALALLFAGLFRITSKAWQTGSSLSPTAKGRQDLFNGVLRVALGPAADQESLWKTFLTGLFKPLSLRPAADEPSSVSISDDGATMLVPGIGPAGPLLLEYPGNGGRLFSRADSTLAAECLGMLEHALESRSAYGKGVSEERSRIALDIHDNIASRLLSALRTVDTERKDQSIRDTMAEIREMIGDSRSEKLPLEESLAELRVETADRLSAAGITLGWDCSEIPAAAIPQGLGRALRAIIREAVSNIIKHSDARRADISIGVNGNSMTLLIADDGCGFDPSIVSQGNGLSNFRERLLPFFGTVEIKPSPHGTEIVAEILLEDDKP